MAFSSSTPVYNLDPTIIINNNNWPPHQDPGSGSGENLPGDELLPPLPPAGGSTGSVQPRSMSDRARLAKIPQPEPGLKCPRCDSTNTKFCYFNNYSLSQPRHFCKTCRRYWTRGGALRNVPVGGSCRRNKRAKGGRGRSKSPVTEQAAVAPLPSSSNTIAAAATVGDDILGHLAPQLTQLPFLPPLHNFNDYAPLDAGAGLGLDFHVGSGDHSQWRMHQMPQLPTFFSTTLEGQGIGQLISSNKPLYSFPSAAADPMIAIKSEGLNNIQDLNLLSRNNYPFVGEQYGTWVGNSNWSSDLSGVGFSSAPTGHLP